MNATDKAIMRRDLDEKVQRGIALLDADQGASWVNKINVDRFDIRSGNDCILGQIYGEYHKGLQALDLDDDDDESIDNGFIRSGQDDGSELQAAWVRAISYEIGDTLKGKRFLSTWEALRVDQKLWINGETHYVVSPGNINSKQEFAHYAHETPKINSPRSLREQYYRFTPPPKEGSFVLTEAGPTFYVGKRGQAWALDAPTARWIAVDKLGDYGKLTVLKTTGGDDFNVAVY